MLFAEKNQAYNAKANLNNRKQINYTLISILKIRIDPWLEKLLEKN